MSNADVARAWVQGKRGRSHNMRTDGQVLYSWRLPIGVTLADGRKVAIRYQVPRPVSASTSKHVGYAMQAAGVTVDAPTWYRFWSPGEATCWASVALERGWTENRVQHPGERAAVEKMRENKVCR